MPDIEEPQDEINQMFTYSDPKDLIYSGTPAIPPSPAVQAWQVMSRRYRANWEWFNGTPLDARDPNAQEGDSDLLYPLKMNVIAWICLKHGSALFGSVPEENNLPIKIEFREDGRDTPLCQRAKKLIEDVFYDSAGEEILYRGGVESQFLGGYFYKVKYDPLDINLSKKIRIEPAIPDFILPIYTTSDYWNLLEAYNMHYIGPEEAKMYGVHGDLPNRVLYKEHWTRERYGIEIGNQVASVSVGDKKIPLANKNQFGFVPYTYIPHPPRIGGFYGSSHVDELIGLTLELNSRMADLGDWVQENTNSVYWGINLTSGMKFRWVDRVTKILDLGATSPATNREPKIGRMDTSASGGDNAKIEFIAQLWKHIEKAGHLPPVTWGVDEGSQRSALTLLARMWPLEAHIKMERSMWKEGIRQMIRQIFGIMKAQNIPGFEPGMEELAASVGWYPIMPQDRVEMVNEAVTRKAVGLIGRPEALRMLSNGEDLEQHVEHIEEDLNLEAKLEQKMKAQKVPGAQ